MKSRTGQICFRFFTASILAFVTVGFTVSQLALAVVPNWTQHSRLNCYPGETPTKPIPALIWGLKAKGRDQ